MQISLIATPPRAAALPVLHVRLCALRARQVRARCAPGDGLALGDGDGVGRELQLTAVTAKLHRRRVGGQGEQQAGGAGQREGGGVLRKWLG